MARPSRCRSTRSWLTWPCVRRPPLRSLTGADLTYVRVDVLHHDGEWRVSEVELTEPGLYLDVVPANGAAFADVLAEVLRR